MIPCFTGDASLTNALRLDDMAEWTAAVRAGLFGRRKGAMPAAFEHPRFFTVEVRSPDSSYLSYFPFQMRCNRR